MPTPASSPTATLADTASTKALIALVLDAPMVTAPTGAAELPSVLLCTNAFVVLSISFSATAPPPPIATPLLPTATDTAAALTVEVIDVLSVAVIDTLPAWVTLADVMDASSADVIVF